VLVIAPQHIENVTGDRSRRFFLKTLEELGTGNPVFIDGNNFAISDGGAFVTHSAA